MNTPGSQDIRSELKEGLRRNITSKTMCDKGRRMKTLTPAIKYDPGKRKLEQHSVGLYNSWKIPHIHIESFPFSFT